eukprot:TRINITY_DN3466_c0_g1_i2.p1 TRINITY_DN3466_c0_g1~~TRINITY_DN3466_c0_g1_i2.p1  ORF type:complete len:380 (+),score=57.86 TRINITY_DN3466_c0_g1_i2:164-1303(+)
MLRSLVGSEMCIRDRYQRRVRGTVSAVAMADRLSEQPAMDILRRASRASELWCFMLTCVEWNHWCNDPAVWKRLCAIQFQLVVCRDGNGAPASSWKHACCSWHKMGFADGVAARSAWLRLRAVDMWSALFAALQPAAPGICDTIQPGCGLDDWARLCSVLQVAPSTASLEAVRCLYEVHDGQEIHRSTTSTTGGSLFNQLSMGILGGFSAYRNFVCSWLLPLKKLQALNQILQESTASGLFEHKMVVGTSPMLENVGQEISRVQKFIAVDVRTGAIGILNMETHKWMPCAPLLHDHDNGGMKAPRPPHQILCWLEEMVRRLQQQVYKISPLIPDIPDSQGINLFPCSPTNMESLSPQEQNPGHFAEAVTRGVLVQGGSP